MKIDYEVSFLDGDFAGRTIEINRKVKMLLCPKVIDRMSLDPIKLIEHELWHVVFSKFKNIESQEQIVMIVTDHSKWVVDEVVKINSAMLRHCAQSNTFKIKK